MIGNKNILKVIALILISAVLLMTASCASVTKYDILGMDFQKFKEEYVVKINKITSDTVINAFYAKKTEGVTYYYTSDSLFVGVMDNKIVYYGYLTSSVFAAQSLPTVKEVLEFEELKKLCGAAPEITETQPNVPFALWDISNGYVGVGSIGSADAQEYLNNTASVFVAFSDRNLCSIGETK